MFGATSFGLATELFDIFQGENGFQKLEGWRDIGVCNSSEIYVTYNFLCFLFFETCSEIYCFRGILFHHSDALTTFKCSPPNATSKMKAERSLPTTPEGDMP
jgi:hypothetical protein